MCVCVGLKTNKFHQNGFQESDNAKLSFNCFDKMQGEVRVGFLGYSLGYPVKLCTFKFHFSHHLFLFSKYILSYKIISDTHSVGIVCIGTESFSKSIQPNFLTSLTVVKLSMFKLCYIT